LAAPLVSQEYRKNIVEPLSLWIEKNRESAAVFVLGISGPQGSGKSTLAKGCVDYLRHEMGVSALSVSIDDFYLTRQERLDLAATVHPLLQTRGVPGTHDVSFGMHALKALQQLQAGERFQLPLFDKGQDDRKHISQWQVVAEPVQVIIFEGWCVGLPAQAEQELYQSINELEEREDPQLIWRRFVNTRLANEYRSWFALLDRLVYLQIPDWDQVYHWRTQQERELPNGYIKSEEEMRRFLMHYERLTKYGLEVLPGLADITIGIDEQHTMIFP